MRSLRCLIAAMALAAAARADFEMSVPMTVSLPSITGPISLTNRQGSTYAQAGWNNDFFEVVALGFDSTSTFGTPVGALSLLGGTDIDGATQWRWQVPKSSINLKPPYASDSTLIATTDPRWAVGNANATSAGSMPFPRYPHAVLRGTPLWSLKYPDTRDYAPPLSSADISVASGAVVGQADYYSPAAWTAKDTAPLFVDTATQHPTQLWIGRSNFGPGGTDSNVIDDALTGPDWSGAGIYTMRSTAVVGLRWAPNSPTGAGVSYPHSLGAAPGGAMWAMTCAFVQEEFGYDLRLLMCIGTQECGMGLFHNTSGGFTDWAWAGDACADGSGDGRYQMINADKQQAIMAFPDWWPHPNSYLDAPSPAPASGLVSETIAMALDLSSRYYGYFSPSRTFRLDELAAASADPWAMTRIVTYGYNVGPHDGNIWALACGQPGRATAISSTNLSVTNAIVGNSGYSARICDMERRIGRSSDVYDAALTWGDVQDWLADLRATHYANGIPNTANWNAMVTDMNSAFVKMQGKAPTAGLAANQISFRYNWLTLLRVMKGWLPQPGLYMPKGAYNNQIDFIQPYTATAEESGSMCSTQNLAPEIYWIEPRHALPTLAQAFPAIGGDGTVCLNKGVSVTVDVLDDYVGYSGLPTGMKVRWALSPGDPSAAGYSLWRDGTETGGAPLAPVATDWALMSDSGPSSGPPGGRRYQTLIPSGSLAPGLRRLYVQADDGAGYKTVGWVDLQIEDCSSFTPTPTPCVPDLGLPQGHGPINCFPDASSISSISLGAAGGSLSWVPSGSSTSDSVGALKYTRSGGSLYYGKLFRLPVAEGSLSGYNQLCVKVWNQTGAASPPLQLVSGSGPTILSTAPQTVSPSSGYTTVCWDLQNQGAADIATSGVELFVNTGGNPVTNGDYLFDEITLRTTGNVTQSDPRCCPSNPPSPTPTATRSATRTATPSASPTRTVTPSPSATPTPSATPSLSPSRTPSGTPSVSPSVSPSASPLASDTVSPTRTSTATQTSTLTGSPTRSITATQSATPTVSGTRSPTVTISPSVSPTALGTFTETPTFTATRTATLSATQSATFSSTATRTATPTVTPSATPSRSYTVTQSRTATPTLTATRTITFTPTVSPSFTATMSVTPSLTLSPSYTVSPSFTVSPTRSPSPDRFFQQSNLILLRGLYPNPFSDRLKIYFTLRVDAPVKCQIYNVAGEPIQTLAMPGKAGKNILEWLGDNRDGARCATGVYVLHLEAKGVDGTSEGFWERVVIAR